MATSKLLVLISWRSGRISGGKVSWPIYNCHKKREMKGRWRRLVGDVIQGEGRGEFEYGGIEFAGRGARKRPELEWRKREEWR